MFNHFDVNKKWHKSNIPVVDILLIKIVKHSAQMGDTNNDKKSATSQGIELKRSDSERAQ